MLYFCFTCPTISQNQSREKQNSTVEVVSCRYLGPLASLWLFWDHFPQFSTFLHQPPSCFHCSCFSSNVPGLLWASTTVITLPGIHFLLYCCQSTTLSLPLHFHSKPRESGKPFLATLFLCEGCYLRSSFSQYEPRCVISHHLPIWKYFS